MSEGAMYRSRPNTKFTLLLAYCGTSWNLAIELGRSTAELIASSTLARNCFGASNVIEPVPRIEVRVCAYCAPSTAQTQVLIDSLTRSMPALVNPSD